MRRDEITVQVVWFNGRKQQTTCGGFARDLIMPVEDRSWPHGFRPVPFVGRVEVLDDNMHGPFESIWWVDGDSGRTKMMRYHEVRYHEVRR